MNMRAGTGDEEEDRNMKRKIETIREAVKQAVQEGIIPGASLGLIGPGEEQQLSYFGRQGVVEPYSKRWVGEGLFYDLASLTKVVGTTTRVVRMLETKQLSLSSRIAEFLPRFQYPEITVEQLLLHNSGLPAEIMEKKSWNRETILDLLYETKPEWGPEERFVYSDVGFILLGKVIEAVDGMGLEESFQKHMFIPLEMRHTSYLTKGDKLCYVPTECTVDRGCICGEVHDRKAYLMGHCGSAGLFSTLEDLVQFTGLYLERSKRLFGEEGFALFDQKEKFGRTLGWSREYGAGTLYHTGFTGTSILMNLERGIGMVLLANRIHPIRDNGEFLKRRCEWNQIFLEE